MSCNSSLDTLMRYADGEADDNESASVYAHLQSCPGCVEKLGSLQAMDKELASFFEAAPFGERLIGKTMALVRTSSRLQPVARPRRRRSYARWAVAAMLLAALGVAWLASPGATPRPIVARATGADLAIVDSEGGLTALQSDAFRQGDVLENTGDAGSELVFNDGSRITLAPGSRARVNDLNGRGRIELIGDGALFADVSHKNSKFVARSGDLEVTVLGTRFAVVRQGDERRVRLYEGNIRCSVGGADDLWMKGGEELLVSEWISGPLRDRQGLEFYPDWRELPLPSLHTPSVDGTTPAEPAPSQPQPEWPALRPLVDPPAQPLDVPVQPPIDRAEEEKNQEGS